MKYEIIIENVDISFDDFVLRVEAWVKGWLPIGGRMAVKEVKEKGESQKEKGERKHKQYHVESHEILDGLSADYLQHTAGRLLSRTTVIELLEWSYQQTIKPATFE